MTKEAITQDTDRLDGADPFSAALCWARIDDVTDGVLSGTSSALARLFIVVNGCAIGAVPAARANEQPETVESKPGAWRFDMRRLPPRLFLEDRLRVEILAAPGSAVVFETREIETARLFPCDGLRQGRGRLEGYIDGSDGDAVRGWVWDPSNGKRRIEVQLFVDGVFRGLFEASRHRPDLQATGHGDGRYGFAIALRDLQAKAGSAAPRIRVVSIEPEVWDVPFAPHTRARARRWPTLPGFRRLPATVREFVAILTGTESFPKKIYVIDRVTQRMPDAFSSDYVFLALEFLRLEMVKAAEAPVAGRHRRLLSWWRQRVVRGQIRRLGALAEATAATQTLLRAQRPAEVHQPSTIATMRHAQS